MHWLVEVNLLHEANIFRRRKIYELNSKKIAAACLALTMVASVGAANAAGFLPTVSTVTASAENSDKLADGGYYVNIAQYNDFALSNISYTNPLGLTAKLKVKDGKYTATVTYDATSYKDDENYKIDLFEKVKDDKYSSLTETPGFSNALLPDDFDSSKYTSTVRKKILDSWDEYFDKVDVKEVGDKVYELTFDVEPGTNAIHMNMLFNYTNSKGVVKGSSRTFTINFDVKNAYTIPDNIFTDFDEEVSYNYEINMASGGYVAKGIKYTSVRAKAENGKLYAKFYYDYDAIKNQSDDNFVAATFIDENGNEVQLGEDKSFTVEYDSIDKIVNGAKYKVILSRYSMQDVDGVSQKVLGTSENDLTLKLNLGVKPLKLTDATTGVSVYTTTHYVSENAVLVSADVPTTDKAYSTMQGVCDGINDHIYTSVFIFSIME